MGDHRLSITIKAEFHGKTYEYDNWMNYNGFDGVDRRIIEFFEAIWDDGYARFQQQIHESEKEQREEQTRRNELAELQRLKEKYAQ
jgi:hypothetical protein